MTTEPITEIANDLERVWRSGWSRLSSSRHFEIAVTDAEQPFLVRWIFGNEEQGWRTSENYAASVRQPDLDWQEQALCAQTDPEAFFPDKGGSTKEAKKVCAKCEVREPCLKYALDNDERFGVFGGLSERERRKLKRRSS